MKYLTDGKRHLICEPYSLDNLHKMAEALDIKKCWFHKDHYDIPKKRIDEIESKIKTIRIYGKKNYINSTEDKFERVYHDYSEVNQGFIKWKKELNIILS